MANYKIQLDAGHGGLDSGAIGNGLKEKDIALKLAISTRDYLKANYTGHDVRLTREKDFFLELKERSDLANKWGADLFVSFHLNAFNTKGKGFETFVYTTPSIKSVALQNILHVEIYAALSKLGSIADRGKKRANYSVLRETKAVAILTENLFIDNGTDGKIIKHDEYIQSVGKAHAVGIAKFLGLAKKVVEPSAKTETGTLYKVQMGAFGAKDNAEVLVKKLKELGLDAVIVKEVK